MRRSARNIVIAGLLALALAGCNTVEGLGEDVSGGARAVQSMM